VELEELRRRARKHTTGAVEDAERFRRDVRAFFAAVPEPPLYRRRNDPSLPAAKALLETGEVLLGRSLELEGEVALREALEAHLLALSFLAEQRVEAAEPAWREAVRLEQRVMAASQLWRRTEDVGRPVFDRSTGVSRFDPRLEAMAQVTLSCPWCRAQGVFACAPAASRHRLDCPKCRQTFVAYVAELRTVQTALRGGTRRTTFRVLEPSGAQARIELDDATGHELPTAPRDRLAFLYAPPERLRGVLNLSTSRVLWLNTTGPCFVATVVFGEDAPQVASLRRFRDEVLMRRPAGRRFVRWYYAHGSTLAAFVGERRWLGRATRALLTRFVEVFEHR